MAEKEKIERKRENKMAKKTIWIVLISLSLLLIITGTVFVVVKKYNGETTIKTAKPTSPKPVTAKPKEEVWGWTFRWKRNDSQWEEAKAMGRKKKEEEYTARVLEITPNHLKMEYVSGYSGKPEAVEMKVGNTGDFYAADYTVHSKNAKQIDLSCKISFCSDPESPGNYTGTFWQDQDGQQVACWLAKK